MATPQQLREEVSQVAGQATAELRASVDALPAGALRPALLDLLPGLILSYSETTTVVAAEWYDDFRSGLDIPGTFTAAPSALRDPGVEALVNWAESEARTQLTMLNLIEGGTFKRVANGARSTVIGNSHMDPQARGYQRYARTTSAGCAFCKMLAGRGAVYRTADSASFASHDNCKCVAVPAFDGAPVAVKPYVPSPSNTSDADRARVRAWIASH